jgi:hypothetical protein
MKENNKQFQQDLDQYKMPEVLQEQGNITYNVGYEASTGNQTDPNHEISKKEQRS